MAQTAYGAQAQRLLNAASTSEQIEIATNVRDGIEVVHTSEYVHFLKSYFPIFKEILTKKTEPTLVDDEENALRHVIYEILNRLPFNEVLRPYEQELLNLALDPLASENEKNALLCLRIIFDLHRNFRPSMDERRSPFLAFVSDVYTSAEECVENILGGTVKQRGRKEKPSNPCEIPALESFKVMTECPLIVMLLYQLYNRNIQTEVSAVIPLMVKFTSLEGHDSDSMSPTMRTIFCDLKAAQVKTISFIAYLLRGSASLVEPYQEAVSDAIVSLLKTCPDVVATRKELLVATRHVLSVPAFCKRFFAHLDLMMDDDILVGTGRMCIESLRPLAYSFLAELVHHMKAELTLPQIRRAVHIFSRNMQDTTLPMSTHMTCARLMHHLVESIFRMRSEKTQAEQARHLLVHIMYATVAKFRTLRSNVPELLETANDLEKAIKAKVAKTDKAAGPPKVGQR